MLAIDPRNPSNLYATDWIGAVFKSTDGGATWANADLPSGRNTEFPIDPENFSTGLAIDPRNPDTLYAATGGLGVFKSTDGARSWRSVNSGLSATSVRSVTVDPQTPGTMNAAASAGILKTTNGGASWSAASSGLPPGSVPASLVIDPQNPSTLYAGFRGLLGSNATGQQAGGIFKSTDGGANWSAENSGLEAGYFFGLLAIDPQNPGTLYAGGIEPRVFGGFASDVFKSTDGGTSWARVGSFGNSILALAIAIDPRNTSTLYISGVWRIFKSTDAGANWNEIRFPPEFLSDCEECLPVGVLAVNPRETNTIYVGGALGILKSTDAGSTWKAMNSGLTALTLGLFYGVDALTINPQSSNVLYATLGGKVFRSTDGAATWEPAVSGLTVTSVRSVTIDPKDHWTVFARTQGGGVFASTFVP